MIIVRIPIPLDGSETSVCFHSTELTHLIAETMRLAMHGTELSFFKGSLKKVLNVGTRRVGQGGFLHTAGITFRENNCFINDQPLDSDRMYHAATNGFLLTGREHGLEFFNRDHPELKVIETGPDLRQALIAEIQRRYK